MCSLLLKTKLSVVMAAPIYPGGKFALRPTKPGSGTMSSIAEVIMLPRRLRANVAARLEMWRTGGAAR